MAMSLIYEPTAIQILIPGIYKQKKVLSLGAGQQSTALALMSVENKLKGRFIHDKVPIYDAIVFCDLGAEAYWVYEQVRFIEKACTAVGIPFYVLTEKNLYKDYLNSFGIKRVVAMPFWSIGEDGKKAKMRRHCTIDYKINIIHKFVRYSLLDYRKGQRTRPHDLEAHEMHLGFSYEESERRFSSYNPIFKNKYPLVDMKQTRADNYKYVYETWGFKTKGSACIMCPFHQNYFFHYLKHHDKAKYNDVVCFDNLIGEKQHLTPIRSRIFVSRSRKRICDLKEDECQDAKYLRYQNKDVWIGF